jgi:hypothetical protein
MLYFLEENTGTSFKETGCLSPPSSKSHLSHVTHATDGRRLEVYPIK